MHSGGVCCRYEQPKQLTQCDNYSVNLHGEIVAQARQWVWLVRLVGTLDDYTCMV